MKHIHIFIYKLGSIEKTDINSVVINEYMLNNRCTFFTSW